MFRRIALAVLALGAAGEACAQTQFLGGEVKATLDLRGALADGEESWTDGGFGKLRFGGDDDDWSLDGGLARGVVVWQPHFGWSADGYLQLEIDPDQDNAVDIGEAYLKFKPVPTNGVRYAARIGAFYPPVSLEHDGLAWSTTRTITPSALNSWIGEEVKVGGAEASAQTKIGENTLGFTGALFGFNDTAGTLLTFRGWAMHDRQATLFGDLPLPTRSPLWWSYRPKQAHDTEAFKEIDGRAGYYGRVEWRMASPVAFDVMHYDNAGDRVSNDAKQSAWETRFTNIGVRTRLAEGLELLAQAMTGQTVWIPLPNGPVPYVDDIDFSAAYVMLDHTFGDQGVAARLDAFETSNNQAFSMNSTPEDGWALTAAWRRAFGEGPTLMLEGVYVSSDRLSRAQVGLDREQEQFQLQSSLRWTF